MLRTTVFHLLRVYNFITDDLRVYIREQKHLWIALLRKEWLKIKPSFFKTPSEPIFGLFCLIA